MNQECIFCSKKEYALENDLCYAVYDGFPVSKGHMLIITKRHVKDFFGMTREEMKSALELVEEGKRLLDNKFNPDAYNIGLNAGIEAGQSVMHLHIHLIPRYKGDMVDPKGGVRGVIPDKQKY